jgi:hypothetical protein
LVSDVSREVELFTREDVRACFSEKAQATAGYLIGTRQGEPMTRRNRTTQVKREREQKKRERQRRKGEKAAQKRERRLATADEEAADTGASSDGQPADSPPGTPPESGQL